MLNRRKGQSSLEYGIFIGVVAVAVTMMSLYFRRSVQAVVKIAADEIGSQKKGVVQDYAQQIRKAGGDYTQNVKTDGMRNANYLDKGAVTYDTAEVTTQTIDFAEPDVFYQKQYED